MVAGERGAAAAAACLAAASVAAIAIAAAPSATTWLHGLLAASHRHPLPEGLVADVGVVLGYALHSNGSCTRPLQSRVEVGVALWRAGRARVLVFSGAHPGGGAVGGQSEANAMADYARALLPEPPPDDSWLLEEASTSTRTNALRSLELIAARAQRPPAAAQGERQRHAAQQPAAQAGGQQPGEGRRELQEQQQPELEQQQQPEQAPVLSVVLVTSPFHQLRALLTFRRAAAQAGARVALCVAAAPVARHAGYGHAALDAAADQLDFWRELAALAWYGARGWL
ncbi:hypothetical protein HT031_002190 [Scenedesmus sp. PABB004]|nr:hypothetical protein HT031_002190 [Scenedesmus sp. PABB004]